MYTTGQSLLHVNKSFFNSCKLNIFLSHVSQTWITIKWILFLLVSYRNRITQKTTLLWKGFLRISGWCGCYFLSWAMIALQKSGKSFGRREVIKFPSTTTGESSYIPLQNQQKAIVPYLYIKLTHGLACKTLSHKVSLCSAVLNPLAEYMLL